MAFSVTPDILTGNSQIDKEHVELFAKINDFMEACAQGKGTDEIMSTINFMRQYTKTHFTNEENWQKRNNYPGFIQHKAFHDQFMTNLDSISQELKISGVSSALVGKINIQLGSALIAHIKTEDVALAKFLKGKKQ